MIVNKKEYDKRNNAKKISNVVMENLVKTNFSMMDAVKAVYSLKDVSLKDYFEVQLDVAARNDSDMTYEKYCSITNFIENGHVNQLTINVAWVYILLGIASKQLPTGNVRDKPETKYLVTIYMILNAMWVTKSLSLYHFHNIYKCFLTDTIVNSHKNQFKIKRILYAIEYLVATYSLSYIDSYSAFVLYLLKNYFVTFTTLFIPYMLYNLFMLNFGSIFTVLLFIGLTAMFTFKLVAYIKLACLDVMREFNVTKSVNQSNRNNIILGTSRHIDKVNNNQQNSERPVTPVDIETFEKLIDSESDTSESDTSDTDNLEKSGTLVTSKTFEEYEPEVPEHKESIRYRGKKSKTVRQ